jgi:lantibiotic modifying enzyme
MTEPAKAIRPVFGPYDHIKAAEAVAAFLGGIAVKAGRGIYWPPQPEVDSSEGTPPLYFYSGSAGHVFFLTQLYAATGKREYLDSAILGARYIIDNYDGERFVIPFAESLAAPWTLYTGAAGVAFVFIELTRLSPDPEIEAFARKISDQIASAAHETQAGLVWSGKQGLMGDWGTILFLLYAAEYYNEASYRELAVRAGEPVLALGEAAPTGMRFNALKTIPGFAPALAGKEFPNFEFGAAGAGYTLARLYEAGGDRRFLDAALESAKYIRSIALEKDGGALIPYRFPDLPDVFYLGFCHGPAGTGRLFYKLYELTGDTSHLDFLKRLVHGLELSGAPETHSQGYWHCYSQCCGTAAQTELFLSVWAATGDEAYLELARRAGRHILGAAAAFSESVEVKWYQAFERVNPASVSLDTGYQIGAAGIGGALLRLGLADEGRFSVIRLPDDPFPSVARKL